MNIFFIRLLDEYVYLNCRKNSKTLFFLAIFFITGLVFGLFFGNNLYTNSIFDDSINFTILIFSNKISLWAIIFRTFFINLQYFVLIFIFSLSVYLIPLHFLFITYKGYVYGTAVIVFTSVLGIHGFSNLLIIVLPQQFLLLFCISLYIANSLPMIISSKKCSCINALFKNCTVYFLLSLSNIIVELLLIYVIIKPFNILI